MWYRVKIDEGDGKTFSRKFIDERVLAEMTADHIRFEVETKNKWLDGVVNEFSSDVYSDGMVLDEIINLIDNGVCHA